MLYSRPAAPPPAAAMSRPAAIAASPTTPAATGMAPKARRAARDWLAAASLRLVACSRCRPRSPTSLIRTRPRFMISYSAPRLRRCSRSPPIPSTSAPASGSRRAPYPGLGDDPLTRMLICYARWQPLAGWRAVGGLPARLPPARARALAAVLSDSSSIAAAHAAGRLTFFGDLAGRGDRRTFAAYLTPLPQKSWFVSAKPPFAGPEAVLAYLSRDTHRVAISNVPPTTCLPVLCHGPTRGGM